MFRKIKDGISPTKRKEIITQNWAERRKGQVKRKRNKLKFEKLWFLKLKIQRMG